MEVGKLILRASLGAAGASGDMAKQRRSANARNTSGKSIAFRMAFPCRSAP